jgi:membrane protein YqaA with SNARE-associated domain
MIGDLGIYFGLFTVAFIAATVLPMHSEAVLTGLLVGNSFSPAILIKVASIGHVLGSIVNWLFGRGIDRFRDRRWFPASGAVLDRAASWYQRYGNWSLLLSITTIRKIRRISKETSFITSPSSATNSSLENSAPSPKACASL